MSKNKLYTLSYFRNRLLQNGISSKILINNFTEEDDRRWMISIYDDLKIICVCYKNNDIFYFEFFDGKQTIKLNQLIQTESMKVIIEFLQNHRD